MQGVPPPVEGEGEGEEERPQVTPHLLPHKGEELEPPVTVYPDENRYRSGLEWSVRHEGPTL